MSRTRPTAKRLHELLSYDGETGLFTWRISQGCVKKGDIAGCYSAGYTVISIDKSTFMAHVLAWFYKYGEWPKKLIDHKNTIKSDNRITNLREASYSLNGLNRKGADKDSISGVLGVSPSRGKWKASIRIKGKTKMLGRFGTKEQASAAYQAAKQQIYQQEI